MTATCAVCELHAESTFKIDGMDCREEVAILERRFKNLIGLEDFSADLMGQRLHVKYDAAKLSTSTIADAVADTGMRAWLEHEEPIGVERRTGLRDALLCLSGATLGLGLLAGLLAGSGRQVPPVFGQISLLVSLAVGAGLTVRKAWSSVRLKALDINVLMVIAVVGAALLGDWAEAAAVAFLFAVAQALEARTLDRARTAIRALMDLTPSETVVREMPADGGVHGDAAGGVAAGTPGSVPDGASFGGPFGAPFGTTERRVSVDLVRPGAVIVIKPGEKIPLDGLVLAGESAINQAPVTGESLPVDKAPGDEVYAGTINGRGALDVRVTRLRRDTTLARIIHLVERAQAERAPSQTVVERFARIYTPAVIALAVVVAVVPPLALGAGWHTWLYRALVLLVVSCPCALVISTPVSIVSALAGAARKGVLIKGGAHLERVSRLRAIAFDKTGTLTHGLLRVLDVVPLNGASREAVVRAAAAIERRSSHPVALAILKHATEAHIGVEAAAGVSALSGRGAEGVIDGHRVLLGNHRLFEERDLCSPALHDRLARLGTDGVTQVLVARDDEVIGVITLADRVRETARDAVALLRHHGIESVVMLTGDSRGTAQAIADAIGVDEFHADLLPEDKVAAIAELRQRFGWVAMVGDGINDAPALATADVGVAMGVAGSDAALETADIALMADELLKIPYAVRLSRATVRNIRVNLAISVVMKAAFVVAAVAGVATLWMAIVADTGASIIVVANALRLLRAD